MRTRNKILSAVGLATGAYALRVRPRMLRWGATDEEVHRPFPGAEIVPGSRRGSTMAATLDASPSQVWPWLVQMGHGRAGWYSWDRLDNGGRPSARHIHPEWQSIAVGDRLPSTPDGKHWFEVAGMEPERFLALRASFTASGRQYLSSEPRPRYFSDALWAFRLDPLPGNRTRLVVSVFFAARPRALALVNYLFWEPAHWIMQKRQFTNLQRRIARRVEHRPAHAPQRPDAPSPTAVPPT